MLWACQHSGSGVSRCHGLICNVQPPGILALARLNLRAAGRFGMYACSCLVERSWRFGLPLVLASVKGGFQTVAITGFFSPVAVAIFGAHSNPPPHGIKPLPSSIISFICTTGGQVQMVSLALIGCCRALHHNKKSTEECLLLHQRAKLHHMKKECSLPHCQVVV